MRSTTEKPATHRAARAGLPRVVIVGAGFGGLEAARQLGRAGIPTTLIDRRNYHLFQPLLYQVATAALSPADIAEPIRKVLRRLGSVDVILAEVTGVDTVGKAVLLDSGACVTYDVLILATGTVPGYFGHDAWAAFASGLKTIDDARLIRSRVLTAFEEAETAGDPQERKRFLTIAVVGGGPTGVEVAGAIAELARYSLAEDFRNIHPSSARILLIEAGPKILAGFPDDLSRYAAEQLAHLGVELVLGEAVGDITARSIKLGGRVLPVGTVIWAAGVRSTPAAAWIGATPDRLGRIPVGPDLGVPGRDDIYALGDVAVALDDNGNPLPGLAQVAQQQGAHLGKALARRIREGAAIPPFHFHDRGNAAMVGRHAAVVDFGRIHLKGWLAWITWAIVHVYLLVGFQHRLLVCIQWLWRYLTYERGARLITTRAPSAERHAARTVADEDAAHAAERDPALQKKG